MSLRTINDNFVELTGGDTTAAQPEAKRQKTEKTNKKPKRQHVWLVIHDKEPRDCYRRRSDVLPERCDTEIVGIYTSYATAEISAENYLIRNSFVNYMEGDESYDDDDDGDSSSDAEEMWRARKFATIDWLDGGWYRQEDMDVNEMNDRVYIQKQVLDVSW